MGRNHKKARRGSGRGDQYKPEHKQAQDFQSGSQRQGAELSLTDGKDVDVGDHATSLRNDLGKERNPAVGNGGQSISETDDSTVVPEHRTDLDLSQGKEASERESVRGVVGDVEEAADFNVGDQLTSRLVGGSGVVSHFWVCTYPYFDSSLFILPPLYPSELSGGQQFKGDDNAQASLAISVVTVYDPDGEVINSVRFAAKGSAVGMIELGPLFGACKMQSGMKFGQVIVRSPKYFSHRIRLMNTVCGAVLSEGRQIVSSDRRDVFGSQVFGGGLIGVANFPINLGKGRQSIITLVNRSSEETIVRCRLVLGKRSPEVDCRIPGFGSRVLHLESVFSFLVQIPNEKTIQSYLRLSLKQGEAIGVQIIERNLAQGESEYFVAVA
jgi:hypothetical protein